MYGAIRSHPTGIEPSRGWDQGSLPAGNVS